MPRPLDYCVYVLYSLKDKRFYIGYTEDLEERLSRHHKGDNTSTKHQRPLELVHCEYYYLKSDATRREIYLKTTKGKRALKIMLKDSLLKLAT